VYDVRFAGRTVQSFDDTTTPLCERVATEACSTICRRRRRLVSLKVPAACVACYALPAIAFAS